VNINSELIEGYYNQLSSVEPEALLLFLLLSLVALWVLNTLLKAPIWIFLVGAIAWLYLY
jgi:hypothetical protein